jgi:hypothetical protein
MKVKKTLLVCWSLILSTSILAGPPRVPDSPKTILPIIDGPPGWSGKDISLTIDRPKGWSGIDQEGEDLNVRCTFKNKSKRVVTFMLADHANHIGAKPYPYGLKARVTNAGGEVLTHTIDMGDWWTSHYYAPPDYGERPGDRVRLRPGEKVVRVVPLAAVLMGLEEDWRGLKAGEYTVELKLGDIVSNRMKLAVAAKSRKTKLTVAPN